MTRYQAALGLLSLGPLTRREFIEITGWSRKTCDNILYQLIDGKYIKRIKHGTYQIQL